MHAVVRSALSPQVWGESLDDRLIDYVEGRELEGYVWGVKWRNPYPGMRLLSESADADRWSRSLVP